MTTNHFPNTGAVAAVPSGTDPTARTTVVAALRCSDIWPSTPIEKERAGLATTVDAYQVICEPNTSIENRHRFQLAGLDLRIRHIARWPLNAPVFYELTLEKD